MVELKISWFAPFYGASLMPTSAFRRRLLLTSLGAFITLAAPYAVADDDTSALEGLLAQPVTTTASHVAETDSQTPATMSVIGADDIRRHGIRSLNEALNYLGLGLFTTNPSHGGEIGGRGVLITADYGNHVLLLIDGHAVNEPYGGSASFDRGLGVPMDLIDHIEVVLGPGAILYGSNAMLGVVNVITKRAKDYAGGRLVLDSELATWGKAGAGGGTTVSLLGHKLEIVGQAEYQAQGSSSLAIEHRTQSPSAYLHIASGDLDISMRGSLYNRSSPYHDSLINPFGNVDDPSNYELERWGFIDAKYRFSLSRHIDLFTRAYADMYSYDWYLSSASADDCNEGQTDGCRRHLRATSRWMGLESRATIDWLETRSLVTMIGADARYERVDADSHLHALGAGEMDDKHVAAGNLRLGVYGQQTARPFRWLSLNGGARLDVAEGYPGAFSPRAMVAITPWESATLKAIYSHAFRAPSTYEREYQDLSELKADHLAPEKIDSIEGSFEQRFGAHRVMFGAFATRMTDMVSLVTLSDLDSSQYRNVGRVTSTGYNAAYDGSVGRFRYGATLTAANARRTDGTTDPQPMTVIPPLYGNARVSYDLGGKLPTLALATQFGAKRFIDRSFDSGYTPIPTAPPMLEFRAAVTGDIPAVRGLSYRLTANYALERTGPYAIGPSGDPPRLNPVDRFRAGVGLTYAFGGP